MATPRDHPSIRPYNQSRSKCEVITSHNIIHLAYEELRKFTDDFSEENYIGRFQFGKVYHGNIESDGAVARPVTVKIWEVPAEYYDYGEGDNETRMMEEFILLQHEKLNWHPGMIKLYGYCCEHKYVGVVYDFESKDNVQNLILKEVDGFTWLNRVKVALGFADLLVFLHKENYQNGPFVIRNIEPTHIMVDKDYNPKLYDFGLITGGIFGHTRQHTEFNRGILGSIDSYSIIYGGFTPKTDVHNFGLLLMKLMSNYVDDLKKLDSEDFMWASKRVLEDYRSQRSCSKMKSDRRSMVAPSLQVDETFFPEDGVEMSKLAMECVRDKVPDRPTMRQVLSRLLKLKIVEKYHDKLDMERMVMKIQEEH